MITHSLTRSWSLSHAPMQFKQSPFIHFTAYDLKICLKLRFTCVSLHTHRTTCCELCGSFYYSDDLKSRRTDVRLAKDNSLMVEGRHFGAADEHKQQEKPTWEPKELSSPSTVSLDSGHSSITPKTKGFIQTLRSCCPSQITWINITIMKQTITEYSKPWFIFRYVTSLVTSSSVITGLDFT